MKSVKRRVEALSFYDHTGIERHLEAMAQKGWLLQRISNYYWTYRKIEPRRLHFAVTYFPKASDFDPGPSEGQQRLLELCSDTGWQLACTWFQMQVLYTAAEEPVPVHTDPALEVDTIHRACKANYLRGYWLFLLISLPFSLLFLSSLISDTLRLLASPSDMMSGLAVLALFLLSAVELTAYYRWRRRAVKAAGYGLFLDTPSTSGFQKTVLLLLLPCLAVWLINLLFAGDPLMACIALMMLCVIFATGLITNAVKRFWKEKGLSAGANRLLTLLASFGVAFLLISLVIFIGLQLSAGLLRAVPPFGEEVPLRVDDLQETAYGNYLVTTSPDESLLLARLAVEQRHGLGDEPSAEIPWLRYELIRVKLPLLYGFCEGQMKRQMQISAVWKGEWIREDAAAWGADRVWRLSRGDGSEQAYLLCCGDTLARVSLSWTPTAQQQRQLVQQLCRP